MLVPFAALAQNNQIKIKATLDSKNYLIHIHQETSYFNNSSSALDTIYFHNWPNAFFRKKTPLAERLLENYNKKLYFAKKKDKGFSRVNKSNYETFLHDEDIVGIVLDEPLAHNDSVTISVDYTVKVPSDRFTKYGRNENAFNLRYWYLIPVNRIEDEWKFQSHLDMDDLYMSPTDYEIEFTTPFYTSIHSELQQTKINQEELTSTLLLKGKDRLDIELSIEIYPTFNTYQTEHNTLTTNLDTKKLDFRVKENIVDREIRFIEKYLGTFPHNEIFVNRITYSKNPVYGLNQLPKFLNPFPDVFEWDIKMFKALTKVYLEKSILINPREDSWLVDGIQTYLMIKYVDEYYPEIRATGNISKIWGYRSFNLAKMGFNDKYPFVFQFATRQNFDQALTTRKDSLSNFNRQIVNKYKSGLGIRYLDAYLNDSIIPKSIKEFYTQNKLKPTSSSNFEKIIKTKTTKDLGWYFNDYVTTTGKIDYKIKDIKINDSTIHVTIKNKRDLAAPISIYGIKDKEVVFQKWVDGIAGIQTFELDSTNFDKLSLNYEFQYPEQNLRDNWKRKKSAPFHRPIQFKLFRDLENPYYNQIFYTPQIDYNFYDGFLLGMRLSNRSLLRKNFFYRVTPFYGIKSNSLTGSFSTSYEHLLDNSKLYSVKAGLAGSYYHFAPELMYRKTTPFITFNINRKSLRDVGSSSVSLMMVDVNKDPDPNVTGVVESDEYRVFNLIYSFSKPEIITDLRYTVGLEYEENFSKAYLDLRYRRLTQEDRQLDFRFYFGSFIHNETTTDYFNFGLTRYSDYLFRLNYFGRSEISGIFSQQYITSEGGFKSDLDQNFANQWLSSFNTSVGIWKWIEVYNDFGLLKNKNQPVFFGYENGIRLNFIHEFLEFYFPIYTNQGWEVGQANYETKIRFVFTADLGRIINLARRGFY